MMPGVDERNVTRVEILAATEDGLYRISGEAEPELLAAGPMRHVVATDDGSVALAEGGTLWSVDDDGAAEFDELGVESPSCLLLDDDAIWIGTESARLVSVRGPEVRVVKSFDDVEGRDAWSTPWGGPAAVRSMDIDDDGVIYVAVHVGGIVLSRDGGETWEPTEFDIDWDVHQVSTVPDFAQTVVAACGKGVAISTDEGATWDLVTAGLHAKYCRAVAVAGETLVVSASSGPDGEQSTLYRMAIDGERFTPCEDGLPTWFSGNIDTHCLAAWDETVVCGTPDGSVFVSEDRGATWARAASDLPAIRAIALP
ncbi:MAG: hypothetical protein QOG49_1065 [Frankiaceae bacterium]|jgi:photosystem II stability/assembly factor-like uncharacterized protein|nr:hypothetical protein [Frankiaceae bacterium]